MDREWAQKTADLANSKPGRGRAVAARGDGTKNTECEAAVDLALRLFGRLDVLVNNVGVAGAAGAAVEVDMEKGTATLDIDVSSTVRVAKYAVPVMECNWGPELRLSSGLSLAT